MRRGQSEVVKPGAQAEYRCCNACGAADTALIAATVQGQDVHLCPDPAACRMRAQARGIWCTYQPAAAS